MNDPIIIRLADFIGSHLCISAEDGQKVFDKMEPLLKNGRRVTISFEGVDLLISLFLNVSIGQLYGSFTEEEVRSRVGVTGLSPDDQEFLKHVVDNAKRYYANPKSYDAAWSDEEGEGEE